MSMNPLVAVVGAGQPSQSVLDFMNDRYSESHFQSLADKVKKTISDAREALGADPTSKKSSVSSLREENRGSLCRRILYAQIVKRPLLPRTISKSPSPSGTLLGSES